MTKAEKNTILMMRKQSKSYKYIADVTGISINTVKLFVLRNLKTQDGAEIEQDDSCRHCKQCGILLPHTKHCKTKFFCSDRCRIIWWNAHRNLAERASAHQQICAVCGSVFYTYHGQYCSRACYGKARSQKAGVYREQREHWPLLIHCQSLPDGHPLNAGGLAAAITTH